MREMKIALVTLAVVASTTTTSAHAQNTCDSTKLDCMRRYASCVINLHSRALKRGQELDSGRLERCQEKFSNPVKGCIAKAEAKQNPYRPGSLCSSTEELPSMAAAVDESVSAYLSSLGLSDSSTPSPPAPGDPFAFETSATFQADITVTVDGIPHTAAIVQLQSWLAYPGPGQTVEDVTAGELYAQGATAPGGLFRTTVTMPTAVEKVDVVVNVPGAAGPYTVEAYRDQWGPFAPSARLTVEPEQLGDLRVELESR